ncbi:MAG: methyltransferase domain-containing protein [Kiritimatiellae bacterium]|nr:methyltransferase domain-containing protein [Kiritimatiellia bacterium]
MTPAKSVPEIVDLASAFYGSAALFAALDLGVFAAVSEIGAPAALEPLAERLGASPRGLRLLLDACVATGILAKSPDGLYSNTEAGRLALVPGGPADLSKAIRYNQDVYPAWGRLAQLARTGAPVEPPQLHLGDDQERTRRFALSMRGRALAIGRGVVPMIDLGADEGRLLDLAGGPGTYAELLMKANPGWSCMTVDVPAVSAVARECIAQAGLADRIVCRPGDYHSDEYEPAAYDAVTIFGALHQESPEQIRGILARAARALKEGGRIFVLDMMTDATHAAPAFSALFAVNMALTAENGWVFSDEELKGWLAEAGFAPGETRPAPPPMPHWLVSAVKVLSVNKQ